MRWAKEHGSVAVCLRPLEGERLITDPFFYPLLEEAERLDMSIAIHIANGNAENVKLYGLRPGTSSGGRVRHLPCADSGRMHVFDIGRHLDPVS